MRIIFAGTPQFAVESMAALHNSNHELIGVYCQPDRPKGRGKILTACPVKVYAEKNKLPLFQPEKFSDSSNEELLLALNPDIIVVAAYGQILPINILKLPKYGCLNIHASLLPRWRGAAPIERAILSGDKETGISIMQMDEGLDTGDVLLTKKCLISQRDNSKSLTDSLAAIGSELILDALNQLNDLTPIAQSDNGVVYAKKILKNEAQINWNQSAENISLMIRAFNPRPIAQTNAKSKQFEDKVIRIIEAEALPYESSEPPGTIIEQTKNTCYVATESGALSLKKVQLSGKNEVSIKDFNNAYQLIKMS